MRTTTSCESIAFPYSENRSNPEFPTTAHRPQFVDNPLGSFSALVVASTAAAFASLATRRCCTFFLRSSSVSTCCCCCSSEAFSSSSSIPPLFSPKAIFISMSKPRISSVGIHDSVTFLFILSGVTFSTSVTSGRITPSSPALLLLLLLHFTNLS